MSSSSNKNSHVSKMEGFKASDHGQALYEPVDKKPAAQQFVTNRKAKPCAKVQGDRPEYYNESTSVNTNQQRVAKSKDAIKGERAIEADAENEKPRYVPTTQAHRRGRKTDAFLDDSKGEKEHHVQTDRMHALSGGSNEKQVHSASRNGRNVESSHERSHQGMKAGAERAIALDDSSLIDKKETKTYATFNND
jgi:hypothetical protein